MQKLSLTWFLTVLLMGLSTGTLQARVVDKLAAFVDDYAITIRELDAAYDKATAKQQQVTRAEVLESMINRYLLLREARKAHLDFEDDDKAISEYLSIKISSTIRIHEDRIREYYNTNLFDYRNRSYDQAREDIETLMTEREFQVKLNAQIKELRAGARIRVMEE